MKIALIAASVAAAAIASPAFAADSTSDISWYSNVGYSLNHASDGDLHAASVRVGGRSTNFGLEAEASTGRGDTDLGGGLKGKLQSQYGVYAVGFWPVGANTEVFARVGYGHTTVKVNGIGSGGDNNANFGVGGQWFHKGGKDGLRYEYTYSYFDKAAGHSDVFGLSWVHKF